MCPVAVVMSVLLLVVDRLRCVRASVHVRWRCESSIEVGALRVEAPVRSRSIGIAVFRGEWVPEVDGGFGIHVVRREYAGHEVEVSVGEGQSRKVVM